MRLRITLALAALLCATGAPIATAHQGSPNMVSVVRRVMPPAPGLQLEVLNRDDRFELVNRTGRRIVIYGYDGDQYARLMPDGAVEVNTRSPAYYLNDDRYGNVAVPRGLDGTDRPVWRRIAGNGRFQWHDHRMHYMGAGTPPSVRDTDRRQKVFDYRIPIRIGDTAGAIDGYLLWTPRGGAGVPTAAIVALVALVAGGVAVTAWRRRRLPAAGDW